MLSKVATNYSSSSCLKTGFSQNFVKTTLEGEMSLLLLGNCKVVQGTLNVFAAFGVSIFSLTVKIAFTISASFHFFPFLMNIFLHFAMYSEGLIHMK